MKINRFFFLALGLLLAAQGLQAQKYFTRTGKLSFYSEAPLEKIEATSQKVTSVMDIESGKMEFAALIKTFQFEKALMQEHFNENYMESDKYPKAKFKGQIVDLDQVDFTSDGSYPVKVSGDLTIHGVTQAVTVQGLINVKDGKISATSEFEVLLDDYDISVPKVVRDNIAKNVLIKVACDYELFEKKS